VKQFYGKPALTIRTVSEECGDILRLTVRGGLEAGVIPSLQAIERRLDEWDALMVTIGSMGGSLPGGLALERLVLVAKQKMPVLAHIKQAHSAALIPAMAADLRTAWHDATLGSFGGALLCCDGREPFWITSDAPEKYDDDLPKVQPSIFVRNQEHRQQLQDLINLQMSKDKEVLRGYTDLSDSQMKILLTGRALIAREANALGLLDRICREDEAYQALMELMQKPKRRRVS
jgi:ClpP class serine protease